MSDDRDRSPRRHFARWSAALRCAASVVVTAWSMPAQAMEKCPAGTGPSPWIPYLLFGGVALMIALLLVRYALLRPRGAGPASAPEGAEARARRPGALSAFVLTLALASPCGGAYLSCKLLFRCVPRAVAPELVCEQLARVARSARQPVDFDSDACLRAWQTDEAALSPARYRDLSSCAVRLNLLGMADAPCEQQGLDRARHAPGRWPSRDALRESLGDADADADATPARAGD